MRDLREANKAKKAQPKTQKNYTYTFELQVRRVMRRAVLDKESQARLVAVRRLIDENQPVATTEQIWVETLSRNLQA